MRNDPVNASDPSGTLRCDRQDSRCAAVHSAAAEARRNLAEARAAIRELRQAIRSGRPLTAEQSALRSGFERRFGAGSATSANLRHASRFLGRAADRIGEEGRGATVIFTNAPGVASAPVNGDRIFVGNDFFNPSVLAGSTQEYVVMHEGGHLAGKEDVAMPASASHLGRFSRGAQRGYGVGATDWLGDNRPDLARDNNESYMCFVQPNCGGPY